MIPKVDHFTKQGYEIRGLVHAGANDGEELPGYIALGIKKIILFEPIVYQWKKLLDMAEDFRELADVIASPEALGAKEEFTKLYITRADKGSSLFPTVEKHSEIEKNWQEGQADIVDEQECFVTRLDDWFEREKVKIRDYNCLVLDTQGNEFDVLVGCGELLNKFDFISVELSQTPIYVGEERAEVVVDWLVNEGFTQDSEIQSHNDVFFVRSDIKPTSDRVYHGSC